MGNIHTVGPNEALVVSGGCCGSQKKIIVGGWSWVWWFVSDIQRLSLEVMTLNPRSENVETIQGVQITVTGVAQCKVMKAEEILYTACEQFLGKKQNDIRLTILQTLEGHLRSIVGTLTVEEVYKDREQFAALVREVAATDVGRMGIEILSFTIKDVFDHVHYLESLGKSQIASVKAEAEIGVAEANSVAGINEANYEKSALDIKYESDTVVEASQRQFHLEKSKYDQEVNKFKAKAELAYSLEAAKIQQSVRFEEMQVRIVERHKQIEIESIEVERKEKELQATTRLPAAAESYKIEALASARKAQAITIANAEAERIRKLGTAEASVIQQQGEAEASAMQAKAQAYKAYGNAALVAIVLDALPKLAAEIAAPLTKTGEIVMLGGTDPLTNELGRVATQLPVALNAMTGLNLAQTLTRMTSGGGVGVPSSATTSAHAH